VWHDSPGVGAFLHEVIVALAEERDRIDRAEALALDFGDDGEAASIVASTDTSSWERY
jgi:hypothetical protein